MNNDAPANPGDTSTPLARLKRGPSMIDRKLAAFGALARFASKSSDRPEGLSEFSVAATAGDKDFVSFPHIKAAATRRSHGLEFRYSVGLHNMRVTRPFKFAPSLLESAHAFVGLTNLKPVAVRLREIASRVMNNAGTMTVPMRLVALGVGPVLPFDDHLLFVIDFEALGDDLKPSIDRVAASDFATLQTKLAAKRAKHIFRDALRKQVMSVGGVGYVDELALRVIDASDVTRAEAVRLLASKRRLEFDAGDEKSRAREAELYWGNGVLRAKVGSASDDWQCSSSSVSLKHPPLPEAVMDALPGRPLNVLVQHPLLPHAATIRELHPLSGRLHVAIETGTAVIDARSGEPRDDIWSYEPKSVVSAAQPLDPDEEWVPF